MEKLAGNAVIARRHFAQVMVRHGYVSTNREAFDRYLDTDEYQKIERFKVSARDCIAAIRSDGGRAALAHPYQLGLDDERLEALIRQLKDSGLEAIECLLLPAPYAKADRVLSGTGAEIRPPRHWRQ